MALTSSRSSPKSMPPTITTGSASSAERCFLVQRECGISTAVMGSVQLLPSLFALSLCCTSPGLCLPGRTPGRRGWHLAHPPPPSLDAGLPPSNCLPRK